MLPPLQIPPEPRGPPPARPRLFPSSEGFVNPWKVSTSHTPSMHSRSRSTHFSPYSPPPEQQTFDTTHPPPLVPLRNMTSSPLARDRYGLLEAPPYAVHEHNPPGLLPPHRRNNSADSPMDSPTHVRRVSADSAIPVATPPLSALFPLVVRAAGYTGAQSNRSSESLNSNSSTFPRSPPGVVYSAGRSF